MARENSQAEELYEVAVLLLEAVKAMRRTSATKWPVFNPLIRRAEKATKVRPT